MSIPPSRAPTCWACGRTLEDEDLVTCRPCRHAITIRHKLEPWRPMKALVGAGFDLADVRLSSIPSEYRRTA